MEGRYYLPYGGSRYMEEDPPSPTHEDDEDDSAWDARPVTKFMGGRETEFFTIGALAGALGKSTQTVRLGIRKGYLPAATYRMPDKGGVKGRRLYTRAQIEAVIEVAREHEILGTPYTEWAQHPTLASDIRARWASLINDATRQ